jgi:CRISPR-associated protein Cas1
MELYINTYGTYVHIKDELFEIRVPNDNGQYQKSHFAAQKVSSIILPKGAALSTDAIHLALKNNIDVVVVENDGHPMGRFWHSKLGSTTKIRKRQLEASLDDRATEYVSQWISQKLTNQINFLKDLKKNRAKFHQILDEKNRAS